MRRNALGEFRAPLTYTDQYGLLRAGFSPALPKIPFPILLQIIALFRAVMREMDGAEAYVNLLWDTEEECFLIQTPLQVVSKTRVDVFPEFMDSRYLHYATFHSHNQMDAVFSDLDDRREQETKLYVVLGRLDQFFPRIAARINVGGTFIPILPGVVLESFPDQFEESWMDNIKRIGEDI